MLPPVVVQVQEPPAAAQVQAPAGESAEGSAREALVQTLLDSCTSAARPRICVLVQEAPAGAPLSAVLTWPEPDRARLRLRTWRGWEQREISFVASDAPSERWRTIGLLLGGTLGGVEVRAPEPRQPEAPAPVAPPEPQPRRLRGETLAAAVLGQGASTGPALAGVRLRLTAMPSWLPLGLTASVGFRWQGPDSHDVSLEQLGGSLGVMGKLGLSAHLDLQLRLEATESWLRAQAARDGREDSASRWQSGGRAGLELGWGPTPYLRVPLGVELSLAPVTAIEVGGEVVARTRQTRAAGFAGIGLLW